MIERSKKNERLLKKYDAKRQALKLVIKKTNDEDERMKAIFALANQPVRASRASQKSRCKLCGRPHGYYKKVQLCRICFRQNLMIGNIPGGRKSSW